MTTLIAAALLVALGAGLSRWSLVVAAPDEWLLLLRNGRLARGGVGVRAWRLPGDVVVRCSSTLQRVAFVAAAQTHEHLSVTIDAFALWSVGKTPAEALKAFNSLGLINYDQDPAAASTRHALTKAQHRAFQAYLCAELQQHVAHLSLREALGLREQQAEPLVSRLRQFMAGVGLEFAQLQIVAVRVNEPAVAEQLAAPEREQLKLRASQAHLAVEESIRSSEMESAARLAQRRATDRLAAAAAELSAEEAEAGVRRVRRLLDAELQRDVGLALAAVDEGKSAEVREFELGRMAIERASQALGALPITDGKWISIGEGGPAGQLLGLAEVLRGFSRTVQEGAPTKPGR